MNFVQPYIFWGLPLVALPVLIHLLNRLRYRSVKWAAMMFLLSATRSSIRRARLRHYLILALRTLAILFLVLALARPIAGGWLGAVAGGAAETVFLVLDRSASMETAAPSRKSGREQAIEMFEQGAGLMKGNVRFILAESAAGSVQEVPGTDSLPDLSLTKATDSSADMPALFAKILDYAVENRCGDMELWVASDMQASNWRVSSPEWMNLKERYGALPQTVRIRVLSLVAPAVDNLSTVLKGSSRVSRPNGDLVRVAVRLERNMPGEPVNVPVKLSLSGAAQQEDVQLNGISAWLMRSLALAEESRGAGWGYVEIPADGNRADNRSYFTYGAEVSGLSVLVSEGGESARILGLASAPDPKGMNQACLRISPAGLEEVQWGNLAMLVWQDGEAGTKEALIESFCRQGGAVVIFPPGRKARALFGLEWSDVETAADGQFSVVSWESMEGPLARTGDGKDLPVSALEVRKRQSLGQVDTDLLDLRTYASYSDGRPFLQGSRLGRGHVYVCTTLPAGAWSDLAKGTVLVPILQRTLAQGALRLGGSENGEVAAMWKKVEGDDWVCVDSENKDPSSHAGVYRIGGKLVALNIPEEEHDLEVVKEEDLRSALAGLELEFVDMDAAGGSRNTSSEIWPLFVFLMGMALLGEAAMLSGEKLILRENE